MRGTALLALLTLAISACDGSVVPRGADGATPASDGGRLDAGPSSDAMSDAGPACPRALVTTRAGESLNIRPDASTDLPSVGSLPSGAIVEVVARVTGELIGELDLWFEIRSPQGDGYIFSGFAVCTDEEPPAEDVFYLPFACGSSYRVTQGNGGSTSHTGRTEFAFDFGMPLDTPIHAMADAVVTSVRTDTGPGDPCYSGGDSSCSAAANHVILQHGDGRTSSYKHLNSSTLSVGASVRQGDVIGRSGSTGYSTGPHLHLELRGDCPTEVYCATVPLNFVEAGVPVSGDTVTSENCP